MDETTKGLLSRGMAALADGERAAFEPVYRTLWPLLVRFVYTLCADPILAEDIAQQAMLKIFAKVSSFDRSRDPLTWSMTIAVNEYRSYRRKLGNRTLLQGASVVAEPIDSDTPEAIAIRDNLRDAARAVLSELRSQDLEVVVAALYEGQRPAVTPPAFRKRLQRVLTATRLIWKKHHGDDRT
jgi:RNA polymerase sigma-70 factor (ECF subfamily)